jgi:very-short-patch-repair endonuclease
VGRKTSWERIARLASRQHGLFTAAQAVEVDIHPTTLQGWVTAGRVKRWHPGVYAVTGFADSWRRRAMAATLAVPGAVVAGLAAAYLHGLLDATAADIVLLAPRGRRPTLKAPRVRTTLTFPGTHHTVVDAIAVTSVARTIVDLATDLAEKRLREVLLDAWRRGLVSPLEVARCLSEVGKVRGAAKLRRALASCDEGLQRTRSIAEIIGYLTVRDAGLPLPQINHRVQAAGRWYEIDLAWPDGQRGIEVDGAAWHTIEPDVVEDEARQANLESAGWRIERINARTVLTDPEAFLRLVREFVCSSARS